MSGNKSWDEIRRESALNEERVDAYGRLDAAAERALAACRRRGMSEMALMAALDCDRVDDAYLSALGRAVALAGAHLELRAVFEDETVELLREPPEPDLADPPDLPDLPDPPDPPDPPARG